MELQCTYLGQIVEVLNFLYTPYSHHNIHPTNEGLNTDDVLTLAHLRDLYNADGFNGGSNNHGYNICVLWNGKSINVMLKLDASYDTIRVSNDIAIYIYI